MSGLGANFSIFLRKDPALRIKIDADESHVILNETNYSYNKEKGNIA